MKHVIETIETQVNYLFIWSMPRIFYVTHCPAKVSNGKREDFMQTKKLAGEPSLESLAALAKKGQKEALEELVRRIQDRIYGLALRTLFLPADAEDATQEILIKVITHLAYFKGESRFTTWVFRIATNHLLTTHKRRAEKRGFSLDRAEEQIEAALSLSSSENAGACENNLLIEEVRLACLQGMLLCLTREIRLAFILGVVFEVTSVEGARILDVTQETFRQRLSRGRKQIHNFMTTKCSLVNPENPCACAKLVPHEIRIKMLDPENLRFAGHRCHARENRLAVVRLQELGEMRRVAALFRSHPDYAAPDTFVDSIRKLVESGRLEMTISH
ncbi:MAG: RNA polymerase subunit sigma-70 [Deltaproteobacteria bacterium HGW-Deltaproteobacteria-21]|nr:MAG: RNA polymerase subunit sigma-70 [Deltaproteobacteria bacterium HGW-Deltaproteobacteria-21]